MTLENDTKPKSPLFRFDGALNIPTLVAFAAAVISTWGSFIAVQTSTTLLSDRVTRIEIRFQNLPERVSAMEATLAEYGQQLDRIESKLDRQADE